MSIAIETGTRRRASRPELARAGLVAGPLWVGIVVLVTTLEWDFLHRAGWTLFGDNKLPYPSYTALGPWGFLQVGNFFVTGVLVLAFVQALSSRLTGWTGTTGRVLLTLAAVAISTSAFRTDRVPGTPSTWHGYVHTISFVVILTASVLGMVFAGLSLRRRAGWRTWGTVTALLGPWQFVMFAFGGALLPGDTSFYLFILTLFGWILQTARLLLRESGQAQ